MVEVDLFAAVAVGVAVLLIFRHVAKKYHYFLSKPVVCVPPTFLFGSRNHQAIKTGDGIRGLYDAYPDSKVVGSYDYMTPNYLIRDLEMIKKITIKDFDHFVDHVPTMSNADDEPNADSLIGNSLFALRGQKWRDMRATMSPAFTGSKMRMMFELVLQYGNGMIGFFKEEALAGKRLEVDIKDAFQRVSSDMIATLALGIEVNSFRDQDNELYTKGKQLVNYHGFLFVVQYMLIQMIPSLNKLFKLDFGDPEATKFFRSMILDNMKQRDVHGIVRNDMIQLLLEARKGALKHEKGERDGKDAGFATVEESHVGRSTHSRVWTDTEIVAQLYTFFFGAFDNVASIMTFMVHELIVNQDVQKQLFEEIQETERSLNGKPLTYDTLQRMKYMDMVVSETLRKYPLLTVANRYCTKDYLYDDGHGTRFTIEKGLTVLIPTLGIHYDAKYYPNPERFEPERFSEENKANIVSGSYLPFGSGPRNCIGSRLALMEVKTIVYCLLRDFSVVPTMKTQIPLQLSKNAFTMKPDGEVWAELKMRKA